MKTVCYLSTTSNSTFPENTNSKFQCELVEGHLSYITNNHSNFQLKNRCQLGGNLTLALKSLSFPSLKHGRFNTDSSYQRSVLGLRSSIISDYIIFNNKADQIISCFIIKNWEQEIVKVDIRNPVFYRTTFNRLCSPKFEIVELMTNSTLQGIDNTTSIPTVCEFEIREVKEDIYHSRMLSPFNMLLLSNDEKSQDMYEKNTNMEFTCNLNQRQDFTSNWSVILKSLQLSSHLYNIQNAQYYFKYVVVTLPPNSNEEGNLLLDVDPIEKTEKVKYGYYPKMQSLTNQLNKQFEENGIPIVLNVRINKIVLIVKKLQVLRAGANKEHHFQFSPALSQMLGFTKYGSDGMIFDLNKVDEVSGSYNYNLAHGYPKHLVINCSIVSRSSVGKKMMKMLRLINLEERDRKSSQVMNFNFLHNQHGVLETKWFDKISISITDLNENIILAENNHPTLIHLLFVNV